MNGAAMMDHAIQDKSFQFAIRIVNLYKYMHAEHQEYVLSKQLLRCGTSIGANVSEAQQAQSKADFVSKMSIALKESYETDYWLRLLYSTQYLQENAYLSMRSDCKEIQKTPDSSCSQWFYLYIHRSCAVPLRC